jgi:hypothetical protein
VEIIEVLSTIDDPAVLDFEDDTAADVEAFAVALRAVVMNADHAAVVTLEHVRISPSYAIEVEVV